MHPMAASEGQGVLANDERDGSSCGARNDASAGRLSILDWSLVS